MQLQVDTVSKAVGGHVDVTAAIHLQPDVFARGLAWPSPPAEAVPEIRLEPSSAMPTAAQQHGVSMQILMDYLLESQQARWQEGGTSQADGGAGTAWQGAPVMS